MMVFAGVSGFTRVCAYDRPGAVAPLKDNVIPSRSDPVPQPRTAPDAVADLHTLLGAAGVRSERSLALPSKQRMMSDGLNRPTEAQRLKSPTFATKSATNGSRHLL